MSLKKAFNKIAASHEPDFPPLSEEDLQWLRELEFERQDELTGGKPLGFGDCEVEIKCNHPGLNHGTFSYFFNVPTEVCDKINEMVENLNPTISPTGVGVAEISPPPPTSLTTPDCPNVNTNLCILFNNLEGAEHDLWRTEVEVDMLRAELNTFIRHILEECGEYPADYEPFDDPFGGSLYEVLYGCMTSYQELQLIMRQGKLNDFEDRYNKVRKQVIHWRKVINWNIRNMVECASWHQRYVYGWGGGCCVDGNQVGPADGIYNPDNCAAVNGYWEPDILELGCVVIPDGEK